MRFLLLAGLTLFSASARAQDQPDAIIVEAGEPVPVPLDEVAARLRAELPGSRVQVAPTPGAGTSSVTVGLLPSGELRVIYRDAAGRETTRIVADTSDPRAVAATIAMIVANLHQSQLDTLLGPAPVAPPVRVPVPVSDPAPAAAPVAFPAHALTLRISRAPRPAPASPGWVLELGGLYAVVAASAVVGIAHESTAGFRIGARTVLAYLPMDESTAFTIDLALTRVGRTRPGRFDFGLAGGLLLVDDGETAGLHVGPFAAYAHRLGVSSSIGARLGVDVALIDGEASVWPTATLFWELPLG
jgi:hypothetical protein